jgi:uncharacterized SAM-binding protein YcdF (DUF218 family)
VWLTALGRSLIRAEDPSKADLAVVLGGDFYGHRVLRAAELVRQGWAPLVLISGPACCYGIHESDLALPFAVGHGYPESSFVKFGHPGTHTREEIGYLLPELRRRGVRRILLVTSDYHTGRAGRIFRRLAPDIAVSTIAARDEFFRPESWWKSRNGLKMFYMEWSKTLGTEIGL